MSAPACDDVPELACFECASEQHDYCLKGECVCLCREGWTKVRFGWQGPGSCNNADPHSGDPCLVCGYEAP